MSLNASGGMCGWRTMLWGWPISSSMVKPLTRRKAVLQWVIWPLLSVVDISSSSLEKSYSFSVIGKLVRMVPLTPVLDGMEATTGTLFCIHR
jgi:hypothetical protein